MEFNPSPSSLLHVDINSCFATIEQQANPFLRYKPVAVAAYRTDGGCILAASYEAKAKGVKTGMRVREGRILCPDLIVLSPDPDKYRFAHAEMRRVLESYSNKVVPKSIDEFVVDFADFTALRGKALWKIALDIKRRIKREIGEYITVSIGISTNRFLAKTAASYRKPDGLFEIDKKNYLEVFGSLEIVDLCGIKKGNACRLARVGINSVLDFYHADIETLKAGFRSVNGYYWYLRLRGYEADDFTAGRKSFGSSYALPKPYSDFKDLSPILTKLVERTARRMRRKNYASRGVYLGVLYRDYSYWHKSKKLRDRIFATDDIRREIFRLFLDVPWKKPVRNLSVGVFDLSSLDNLQLSLDTDLIKKDRLVKAIDFINDKWGDFSITPARTALIKDQILDRIAFGATEAG